MHRTNSTINIDDTSSEEEVEISKSKVNLTAKIDHYFNVKLTEKQEFKKMIT
jgi:hypothetical protein